MPISSASGIFASSLYKAYFGDQSTSSTSASSKSNQVNSDAIVSQLGDVKSKLLSLAAKAKQLTERHGSTQSDSSDTSLPPTYTTADNVEVSISTANANKPTKFENQISKALSKSYSDPDKALLSNSKVEGDVKVTLKDGDDTSSFSVHVDKHTTVQQFVDEFNQKADGKATAELSQSTVKSKTKYKIDLVGSAGTPIEAASDDSNDTETVQHEADAAQFEKDLKDFIGDVNKLVGSVTSNKDGITSIDSNVGLLDSLKDLVKNLKSDDRSVSLASIVSQKSSGGFSVNGSSVREAFLNNSDGVASLISNLSDAVSGNRGLTQTYAAYGGSLDKISTVVKVIGEAQDKYNSDGLSLSADIKAQRDQNIQSLVTYAGQLAERKAS